MQLAWVTLQSNGLTAIEYLLDLLFAGDIVASFNTAYFSGRDDAYMTHRPKIVKEYLQTWFSIDICSCFPFSLVVAALAPTIPFKYLQIIQLVKVLRMLRIFKLLKTINFTQISNHLEDSFGLSASVLSLIRTVVLMVFGSHLVACFWWGITAGGAVSDPNHW